MKAEQLTIGGVDIEVTFKDIKNLHLSVHPPLGRVTISSPTFYDLEKVRIYAASKLAWIRKEQQKFQMQAREDERLMITRESHYLFGERYLLEVADGKRNGVKLKGRKMILTVIDAADRELKRRVLYHYYRRELRKKLDILIPLYAGNMRVEVPPFKIRTMKTKWGSCASDFGRLWFNIELAKKPIACIEYVVVHELVHLLERHHNKRFVLLMDRYYPSWRTQKKLLNELPLNSINS